MLNPMMASLMRNKIGPMKKAFGMIRSASNPQMMFQQMISQNPNYPQAQQLIQQSGGNAQKAFYDLAGQMGIDPNDILNSLC